MGCVTKGNAHSIELKRYLFKHSVAHQRVWLYVHCGHAKDLVKVFFVKNCVFHGEIKSQMKENVAILILDNGEVLIGNFVNDQLEGDCVVFINSETYAIGSFSRGLLNGAFVLRNPSMTIYWTTKMNKVQG
jgi:hypothetical protein